LSFFKKRGEGRGVGGGLEERAVTRSLHNKLTKYKKIASSDFVSFSASSLPITPSMSSPVRLFSTRSLLNALLPPSHPSIPFELYTKKIKTNEDHRFVLFCCLAVLISRNKIAIHSFDFCPCFCLLFPPSKPLECV